MGPTALSSQGTPMHNQAKRHVESLDGRANMSSGYISKSAVYIERGRIVQVYHGFCGLLHFKFMEHKMTSQASNTMIQILNLSNLIPRDVEQLRFSWDRGPLWCEGAGNPILWPSTFSLQERRWRVGYKPSRTAGSRGACSAWLPNAGIRSMSKSCR